MGCLSEHKLFQSNKRTIRNGRLHFPAGVHASPGLPGVLVNTDCVLAKARAFAEAFEALHPIHKPCSRYTACNKSSTIEGFPDIFLYHSPIISVKKKDSFEVVQIGRQFTTTGNQRKFRYFCFAFDCPFYMCFYLFSLLISFSCVAPVARIARYIYNDGIPVITGAGYTFDFEEPKTLCENEFHMLIRTGLVSFKRMAYFMIDLIRQ